MTIVQARSSWGLDGAGSMMYYHTEENDMGKAKIAITIDEKIVVRIDNLVKQDAFVNRSQAIEEALRDKLNRIDRSRLARESAKLDPKKEKSLAEEGIREEAAEWPEY
jgi:Arc/MetJ-type ribon-helix-helix transcriptional regulator